MKDLLIALVGFVIIALVAAAVAVLTVFPELRVVLAQAAGASGLAAVAALACWGVGGVVLCLLARRADHTADWEESDGIKLDEWHPFVTRLPILTEDGVLFGTKERRRTHGTQFTTRAYRLEHGEWEYR